MKAMIIIGVLLIVFGAVDLIGGWVGFDLWGTLGIQLPEIIWRYSPYIAVVAGFGLIGLGTKDDESNDNEPSDEK